MNFLSLFAGIGGFDLGLERAGMNCVGQVEIEPFCQKVLANHWPNVWRWNDVNTLTGEAVKQNCGTIDLLCGGVPCQPASVAGKRKGTADHRWLWPSFLRLVSEIKPLWVLAENPRGVLSLDVEGLQFSEWIAREFAVRGYELLPVKLAAEDVGAPHRRERVFFVAYSASAKRSGLPSGTLEKFTESGIVRDDVANTDSRASAAFRQSEDQRRSTESLGSDGAMANADSGRSEQDSESSQLRANRLEQSSSNRGIAEPSEGRKGYLADAYSARLEECWPSGINGAAERESRPALAGSGYQWPSRPGQSQHEWEEPRTVELPMGGTIAGLSVRLVRRHRVAALKALGNAIVPQCAEVIGRAIMQLETQ